MVNDAYTERMLVAISPIGGSAVRIDPIVDTLTFGGGEKGAESIANSAGGRIMKLMPQSDVELEFEGYVVGIGVTSGDDVGVTQFFHAPDNTDTSEPYLIQASHERKKFRVAILWTSDTTHTDAETSPTNAGECDRITFVSAYIVSDMPDWSDKIKKQTFRFVIPVFDKDAGANWQEESSKDCSANPITNLGSYTTGNKF